MPKRAWRSRPPLIPGLAAVAVVTAAAALMPPPWRDTLRENALDRVLQLDAALRPSTSDGPPPVAIVDIDQQSLEKLGPWPLRRSLVARLVAAIATVKPRVIVFDVLFADADGQSPAALARQLGAMADRPDVAALADSLPDGDRLLARAMTQVPVVLGFVLDPLHDGSVTGVPVLVRGPPPSAGFWRARGAIGPLPDLSKAAAGLGALPLPTAWCDGCRCSWRSAASFTPDWHWKRCGPRRGAAPT
jgi:adenylate cyclase